MKKTDTIKELSHLYISMSPSPAAHSSMSNSETFVSK